jgi:flavodoxin
MANIGIIVYSQTGNTLSVAQRLAEKLEQDGHTVSLERIEATTIQKDGSVTLTKSPPVDNYENLVFGTPVQAFSLSQAMKSYLEQLPSLQDKTVDCLITKQLPFNWTGGNRTFRQMKRICENKGAVVRGHAIIHWRPKQREQESREAIAFLSNLFSS